MILLIFALLVILTFTALSIERILKDIRSQNAQIIEQNNQQTNNINLTKQ